MARLTKLPLQREVTLLEARDTLLLYIQSKSPAGVANNLSSHTLRGEVKAAKGASGAKLCDVRFDNTLATGIIKAYLNEADYTTIVTAVGAGGKAYADIVRTSATGWDEQLAEIELSLELVVTGAVAP